jgi:hypothetical protein
MVKVGPTGSERDVTTVKSLPERAKQYEITFPRVVGYINDVKYRIDVDWDSLPSLRCPPKRHPLSLASAT